MKHFLLILALLSGINSWAYTPSPDARVSVLTCSPGKEIYKIYGHSAIRFKDKGKDLVFNYGLFSFDEPHFIWRYLQGKNYYLLGVETFRHFITRYQKGGERVTQQTLNLNHQETIKLYEALIENAQPENREYLYNVFYDNCATRVYHIIEDQLPSGIIWSQNCEEKSFRTLLHEHNRPTPFSQLGIDIVFGTRADKTANCKEQMFLPLYLEMGLAKAKKSSGSPLIKETEYLLEGKRIHNNTERIIFHSVWALLLILAIWVRFTNRRTIRIYQMLFYSLVGLCSLVVCFIAFFSIHPTVLPNLNLIWINPLWLAFALRLIIKKRLGFHWQKVLNIWAIVLVAYLTLGLVGAYYIHYGLIYILGILISLSYKRRFTK